LDKTGSLVSEYILRDLRNLEALSLVRCWLR